MNAGHQRGQTLVGSREAGGVRARKTAYDAAELELTGPGLLYVSRSVRQQRTPRGSQQHGRSQDQQRRKPFGEPVPYPPLRFEEQ